MDTDLIAALAFVAAVYCAGGLHGLFMAWSQPARMRRWARRVDCFADKIIETLDAPEPAKREPKA